MIINEVNLNVAYEFIHYTLLKRALSNWSNLLLCGSQLMSSYSLEWTENEDHLNNS
jgi:hypothetical protein